MSIPADMSASWQIADDEGLPRVFTGGWVGYSGYDTVRYVYSGDAQVVATWMCTLVLPNIQDRCVAEYQRFASSALCTGKLCQPS